MYKRQVSGSPGGDLETSWGDLGASWEHLVGILGVSWGILGASGKSWEGLGGLLEQFVKHVSSYTKILKKSLKKQAFFNVFEVWRG